jgi:hypothetical protein
MTTKEKESLAHQAPAGHKTAHPPSADRGSLAYDKHQGAHGGEDVPGFGELGGEDDQPKTKSNDKMTAKAIEMYGIALTEAAKMIGMAYSDVKEAILSLVQIPVEKIVKADDLNAVVHEQVGRFDIEISVLYDFISNLTGGESKAGGLTRKVANLFNMTSGTAPLPPSTTPASTTIDSISAGLEVTTPIKSTTLGPNAMISIADARDEILTAAEPNYSVEVSGGMYGSHAVTNPAGFGSSIRIATKTA